MAQGGPRGALILLLVRYTSQIFVGFHLRRADCVCVLPVCCLLSFDILMDWPWLIVSWEKRTLIVLSENEETGAAQFFYESANYRPFTSDGAVPQRE